ncbi:MAG: hypothetical protein GXP08_13180 [Gammaproteobacteria bacterium]|nr:hypothetical protein [Gammaproteobacteria bacterium]
MSLVFFAPQVIAKDSINLRLTSGIVSIDTDYDFAGQDEEGQNWLLQIMQYIPEGPFPHAWGLEIGNFTVLSTDEGDLSYDTVSLFVEATPVKSIEWLRSSIGTSGYIGDGLSENKVFGVRVGVGAEVPLNNRFRLVGYIRRDSIFDQETTTIFSVQLGVQARLR